VEEEAQEGGGLARAREGELIEREVVWRKMAWNLPSLSSLVNEEGDHTG